MSQWVERIKNRLGEIISLVSLLVGYGMAVTGQSPSPWPQTTAVLIVIVSTLFLWGQWWPRISHQSDLLLLGSAIAQYSWLERLLDPFRTSSHRSYTLPLTYRRVEGTILSALTLGAFALSFFRLSAVIVEIFPSALPIPMNCVGDGSSQALRIVIAEFNKVGDSPLLEDRLFDQLTDHSKWMGGVHVCRVAEVIKNQSEAIELGKRAMAAIVVWGRSDPSLYEVNFEIAEWDLSAVRLRSFPTPEAMTPEFQLREPLRTSFLTEFILSQLLYIRGDVIDARDLLRNALGSVDEAGLDQDPENAKDLAEAYFLLGYLYDYEISSSADLDLAINYYSQALSLNSNFYSAYLNRGYAYQQNGQTELATTDFEQAVSLVQDSRPHLAAPALINLAWLYADSDPALAEDYFAQAILLDPLKGYTDRGIARLSSWQQPAQAVDDFVKALALDHTDPYLYHFLGQAQLLNDQPEEAIRTYQNATESADWQPDDKETMIDDLRSLEAKFPNVVQAVKSIINILESASLP